MPDTITLELIPTLIKNWSQLSDQFQADFGNIPPDSLANGAGKLLGVKIQALTTYKPGQASSGVSSSLFHPISSSVVSIKTVNEILGRVSPHDLPISPITSNKIKQEKDRVLKSTRSDFEAARDEVRATSADFADLVGAGSDTFNRTYNRLSISSTRTPTDDEMDILFSLNELAITLDHLAASKSINPPTPTSIEYLAGLAERSGIAFTIPKSKYVVPFPYGFTLEKLALLYLKSANRWHEIAALNGLRSPYIDETGFSLPFLTNGDGSSLYVADTTNLYTNQTVFISSDLVIRNKRHITGIKQIYANYWQITVDGASDLSAYSTNNNAKLEAFLPGTVNSQQIIYIPSDNLAPAAIEARSIPGINEFDPLLQVSGIDLLLTPSGDLAIGSDGDIKLAYGLQNIVQTIRLALATPKGSLLQHPQFGIDIPIGGSLADISASDLLKSIQNLFDGNSTFTGVSSAVVENKGSSLSITLVVGIKGLSQVVPLNFIITR